MHHTFSGLMPPLAPIHSAQGDFVAATPTKSARQGASLIRGIVSDVGYECRGFVSARPGAGVGLDPSQARRRSGPLAPWQSAAGNGAKSSGDTPTEQAHSTHAPLHSNTG